MGNLALTERHHIDLHAVQDALEQRPSQQQVFVARNGRLAGVILLADVLRADARAAVQELQALGLRTLLLTGDTQEVAEAVGSVLGFTQIFAQQLPEQKLQKVGATVGVKRLPDVATPL